MKAFARTVGGVLAGMVAAFALVIAVEMFGAVAHPFPEGFDGSTEAMCRHVERFPAWVLAAVVPMWGATAACGVRLARRIGGVIPAAIVGLLLSAAVVLNISMLPYPIWFKGACLIAVPGASVVAARRRKVLGGGNRETKPPNG